MKYRSSFAPRALCVLGWAAGLLAACGGRYQTVHEVQDDTADDANSGGAPSAGRGGAVASFAGTASAGMSSAGSSSAGSSSAGSSSAGCGDAARAVRAPTARSSRRRRQLRERQVCVSDVLGRRDTADIAGCSAARPRVTTSTSPAEATQKLNAAMFWGGFPAQPIHSTGFLGKIDDVVYGQQPSGLLQGFSDNLFIFPNDHGRIFGPDPVQTSTGYVWSGAFSTEVLSIYNFLPAHSYVSSDMARTALATRLILTGQATYVGMVPLNNAVNDATTTTGDHDGYAVVLRLN